jgi:hypothetical protein
MVIVGKWGMGIVEWGMQSLELTFYSPLPTRHSPLKKALRPISDRRAQILYRCVAMPLRSHLTNNNADDRPTERPAWATIDSETCNS